MKRALLILPLTLTLAAPAFASEPTEAEKRTMAEAIFVRASTALAGREYAVACPGLEEVVRLQPNGIGARITLGDCYAASGRLASAHASYAQAGSMASIAGQPERAEVALAKAALLEPRLSKLTVKVPPEVASLPGLTILRGSLAVTPSVFNLPMAVDGGRYTVAAAADGRPPFTATVDVEAEGGSKEVEIQLGAPLGAAQAPAAASTLTSDQPAPSAMPPMRVAGIVVGSIGLAIAGVGVGLGVHGLGKSDDATAAFEAAQTEPEAAAARDEHAAAGSMLTAGWVMTGVGAAAAVAGVVLIAVAPSESEPKQAAPSLHIRASAGRLLVTGAW